MNILFATYGRLSVGAGAIRSVSLLRALADAGHQVDVIAAGTDIESHTNVQILVAETDRPLSKQKLHKALRHTMRGRHYDAVHAVDDAIIPVTRWIKPKRTKMVYEASRCFTGTNGEPPTWFWKLFPTRCEGIEKKILRRSALVFSSCDDLTSDLRKLAGDSRVVQVEDIPAQPLFSKKDVDKAAIVSELENGVSFLVGCSVLQGNRSELRTLLLAARKVLEKIPRAGFFFKGVPVDEAQSMAANLEIQNRCIFLPADASERFLSVLSIADAALFVPRPGCRYRHPDILTLLNSPALVVAIHEGAYSALLSDRNSYLVDYTATSIAEGLLRVVQEPLIAFGIVAEAQQLIADRYSFSSFKHKVRLAYHDLANRH